MAKKISKKISVVKQTKYSITDDELVEIINKKKKDEIIVAKKVAFVNPKIPDKTKQQIYTADISDLKQLVSKQERHLNNSKDIGRKNDLSTMRTILDKYDNETFYLTYKTENLENKKVSYNWQLYTVTEFRTKFQINKDFDLSEICYSNGEKPIKNIKYPTNYKKSSVCYNVEQLAFKHDNLIYVHPELLKVCKYFF